MTLSEPSCANVTSQKVINSDLATNEMLSVLFLFFNCVSRPCKLISDSFLGLLWLAGQGGGGGRRSGRVRQGRSRMAGGSLGGSARLARQGRREGWTLELSEENVVLGA